ncbi:MAG: transposase [Chlamydia sp.]
MYKNNERGGIKDVKQFDIFSILMPMIDKLLLRTRRIIETVINQLKNISQIAHSRNRNPINFAINIFAGLIAYTYREKKPSIYLHKIDLKLLTVC